MKEQRTAWLVIASLAVFAVAAFADVEITEFDKRYVLIKAETIGELVNSTELEAQRKMLGEKQGMAIHIAGGEATDAQLLALFSRLTADTLRADSLMIAPAGEWQYVKPLVLSVPEAWKERPLVKLFLAKRPFTADELSGMVERAKNELRELVFKMQREMENQLQKMFQGR